MAKPFMPPAEDLEVAWAPPEEDLVPDAPTSQGRVSSAVNTLGRGLGGAVLDALKQGWQSASRFSPIKIGSDLGKSLASNVGAFSMGHGPEAVPVVRKVLDDMQSKGAFPDPMDFSAANLLSKGAGAVNEALQEALPTNPEYQEEWLASKIPGAVGQMAGIVLPAIATKGTSASSLLPRVQGFLLGMKGGYEEADRQGITDPIQRDAMAASFGGVEGLTEALGGFGGAEVTKKLLGEVGRRGGEKFISHLIKTATTEGGEEAAAGTLQDIAANVFGGGEGEAPPSLALKDMLPKRAEEFALGAIAAAPLGALTYAGDSPPVTPPALPSAVTPAVPVTPSAPPPLAGTPAMNSALAFLDPTTPEVLREMEGMTPEQFAQTPQGASALAKQLAFQEQIMADIQGGLYDLGTDDGAANRELALKSIDPTASPEEVARALLLQQELLSQLRGDAETGLTDLGAAEGDVLEGVDGTIRPAVLRGTESGLTDLGEVDESANVIGGPAAQAADVMRAERRANSVEGMEDMFVRNPEGQWVHVLDGVPTNIPVSPQNQPVLEERWQQEQAERAVPDTAPQTRSLVSSDAQEASLAPPGVQTPPSPKDPSESPENQMQALQAEAAQWESVIATAREAGASPEVLSTMEGNLSKVFQKTVTVPLNGENVKVPAFVRGSEGMEPNLALTATAAAKLAAQAPKPATAKAPAKKTSTTKKSNVQAPKPTPPPKASRAKPAVQAGPKLPPVAGSVPAPSSVPAAQPEAKVTTQSTEELESQFKAELPSKWSEADKEHAWRMVSGGDTSDLPPLGTKLGPTMRAWDKVKPASTVERAKEAQVLKKVRKDEKEDQKRAKETEDAKARKKIADTKDAVDQQREADEGTDDIQLSANEQGPSANLNSFHVEKVKRELGATKEGRWVLERVEIYETTEQAAKALGVKPELIGNARGVHQGSSGRSVVILNNINLKQGETPIMALRGTMVHEAVGHGGLQSLVRLFPEIEAEMLPHLDNVRANGWTYKDHNGYTRSLLDEYPKLNPNTAQTIEEKAQREEFLFQEWFARSIESTTPEALAQGKAPSTLQKIWDLFHRMIARLLGRPTSKQTRDFAFDIASRIFKHADDLPTAIGPASGGSVRASKIQQSNFRPSLIPAGADMSWSLPQVDRVNNQWTLNGKPIGREGVTDVAGLKSIGQLKDAEIEMYRLLAPEAFTGGRVSIPKLVEGLEKNGPAVEVHTYGQGGKIDPKKEEYDQMTHEWWDVLGTSDKAAVVKYMDGRYSKDELREFLSNKYTDKEDLDNMMDQAVKYSSLQRSIDFTQNTGPRATSYYNSISPFDTKKHPVIRVDVVLPMRGEPSGDEKQALAKKMESMTPEERSRTLDELGARVKDGTTPLWQQDDLHENLPNTLGWAMAQVVKDPKTGEDVLFVGELQSRWQQTRRKRAEDLKVVPTERGGWDVVEISNDNAPVGRSRDSKEEAEAFRLKLLDHTPNHPALEAHQSLVLKAVIAEAKKRGISKVAISDGETAMMTEMHDQITQNFPIPVTEGNVKLAKETEMRAISGLKERLSPEEIRKFPRPTVMELAKGRGGMTIGSEGAEVLRKLGFEVGEGSRPAQEGGMRLAYDTALPSEMKRLTGDRGVMEDFGVHKNAIKIERARTAEQQPFTVHIRDGGQIVAGFPSREAAQEYIDSHGPVSSGSMEIKEQESQFPKEHVGSPVFRNPDGTPKSNVTARVYDLSQSTAEPYLRRNSQLFASAPTSFSPPQQRRANGFLQAIANILRNPAPRTPSGLIKGRSQMGTLRKLFHDIVGNPVDEAKRVHPLLGATMEQIDFRTAQLAKDFEARQNPAWKAIFNKLSDKQDKDLRIAYLRGDIAEQHRIVQEVGADPQVYEDAIRGFQTDYDLADKAGIKMKKVGRYLPTGLKPGAYPKMVEILAKHGLIDDVGRVLGKDVKDLASKTEFEAGEDIQAALRQLTAGAKGGHFKSRTGVALDQRVMDEIAPLYRRFDEIIPHYGMKLTDAIVRAELFGPEAIPDYQDFLQGNRPAGDVVTDKSPVGLLLARLTQAGELDAHDLTRARELFNVRMGYMPDKALGAWLKSGNMALALGNPLSALKQPPAELVKSLWANGVLPTIAGVKMALTGRGIQAQGHLNLSPDFEIAQSNDPIRKYNHWVSKMSGFRKADLFPANAMANAYLYRLKQMNPQDRMKELEVLKDFFSGTDKDIALQDVSQKIANDQFTDPDVWRVAWHGITNNRPTGLGTQPIGQLRSNASANRVVYNLKGWPLRTLSQLKEGTFDNLRSGDPERVKEGLGQLSVLVTGLVMAGASADSLVDWLLGKDVEFEEKVQENMLKLALGSRYQLDQLTGPKPSAKDAILNYMATPSLTFVDAAWKNIIKDARDDEKGFMDYALKDKQLVRAVPLGLGTMALHWSGEGGAETRERVIDDRLPKQVSQLTEEYSKLKELGEDVRKSRPSTQHRWERLSDFSQIKSWRVKLAKEAAAERDFAEAEAQLKALERISNNPTLWEGEAERIRGLSKKAA